MWQEAVPTNPLPDNQESLKFNLLSSKTSDYSSNVHDHSVSDIMTSVMTLPSTIENSNMNCNVDNKV